MGKGVFYGGITAVIVGIISIAGFTAIQGLGSYGLSRCDSFSGQLSQALSEDQREACMSMVLAQTGGGGLVMFGWGILILGVVLTVVGGVQMAKRPTHHDDLQTPIQTGAPMSTISRVFCRYCGRMRPVAGTNCSECGKPTVSSVFQVKKCDFCAASMSADSEFCANCGRKFNNASRQAQFGTTTGETYCAHCGTNQPLNANFCPKCGKPPANEVLHDRKCQKCNSQVNSDALFCGKCGQRLT
jgi:membrane protease subunit (stomatin/prohibitin family)